MVERSGDGKLIVGRAVQFLPIRLEIPREIKVGKQKIKKLFWRLTFPIPTLYQDFPRIMGLETLDDSSEREALRFVVSFLLNRD